MVCTKVFSALKPGGSFWIVDLVSHGQGGVEAVMRERYGAYLMALGDQAYRDAVFGYIEKEDSPVPVLSIVDDLRSAGFAGVEVLHKHNCFAALGGVRPG